ncbi:hypothetical protein QYE76_071943 [Lolium multiflorum]|uniref:F-box domain-containing protein n=1 Tax=Lolium multiflorum TaxID=4521 RepID=A0AAD8UWV3_LOLMU|nr:hypothetical protein QYE76_071943 [Lolium multiflorum]
MEEAAAAASAAAAAAKDAALSASVAAAAAAKDAAVAAATAKEATAAAKDAAVAASAAALNAEKAAATASAAALNAKEAAAVAMSAGEAAVAAREAAAAAMQASKKRKFNLIEDDQDTHTPESEEVHDVETGNVDDGGSVDLISRLPDAVLCSIVSLLPTKGAARTQAISRRWHPLWRSAPLNLVADFDSKSEGTIDLISNILSEHPGPARRFSFCLCISECSDKIEGWLNSRALDNLQELELTYYRLFDDREKLYPLPLSVYRFAPTLRVAKFQGCHFRVDLAWKQTGSSSSSSSPKEKNQPYCAEVAVLDLAGEQRDLLHAVDAHQQASLPPSSLTRRRSSQNAAHDGAPCPASPMPGRPGGRRHLAGARHLQTPSAKLRVPVGPARRSRAHGYACGRRRASRPRRLGLCGPVYLIGRRWGAASPSVAVVEDWRKWGGESRGIRRRGGAGAVGDGKSGGGV